NAHVGSHVVENGRLHIVPAVFLEGSFPAEGDARTLRDTAVDVSQYALHVALVDERAHLRGRVKRMAERDRGRNSGDGFDQSILDALVHNHAGAGMTGFSRVVVDTPRDARGGRFEVRILHDHVWAL